MIITGRDVSIMLSADSNPFGLRIKAYDKNGDMIKGIIKIDLVSLKAEQVAFDSNDIVQLDVNGNIIMQIVEVDLITIEHPSGSDSLVSRRVINVGSINP